MPDTLETLLRTESGPKVSIYLPTHRSGPETLSDASNLEKELGVAKERLVAQGLSPNRADRMLANAMRAVGNESFWQNQSDGLGVFIAPAGEQSEEEGGTATRFVKLTGECPRVTVVGDTFHLRPLLIANARDGEFYVLTITRDNVSLFQGDREGLNEIEPEGMVTGIEDVTWKTDYEDNAGFHPDGHSGGMPGAGFAGGKGGAGQDGAPRYHSLGRSPEDYDDVEFEKFVRQIAKAVDGELVNSTAPLVVIADSRTVGWYKKEARYRFLVGDVQKNPQDYDLDGIHAQVWEMVRPHLDKDRDEALERLEGRLASGDEPASNELSTLVKAAHEGRIDTLFLARHVKGANREWGSYDSETRALDYSNDNDPEAQDLVNLVAVATMMNGGTVSVMPRDKADEIGQIAAIMRY